MDNFGVFRLNWHFYTDTNLAQLQEFLDNGGDPNHQEYSGVTVFHEAVRIPYNNIKAVRKLINAGADVNLRTHLDFTPLHFAVSHQKQQVVEELIQSGANVNAKDFLGRRSLNLAVSPSVLLGPNDFRIFPEDYERVSIKIVNKLLKRKDVDYNAVDSNGETALMMAVKNEQNIAAALLLWYKANPNICNNDFETPLHVAFVLPPSHIEIYLLISGANIYIEDKNGQTPLDILLKNGLSTRPHKWMCLILKSIAFRYNIRSDLKTKFEIIPQLSQFFNKCCDEVDNMRKDIISGKLTMHDFFWNCFDENDFKFLLLQIHKPVLERLIRDIYSQYLIEILAKIPEFSLFSTLNMTACLKRHVKSKGKVADLADLFSIFDVIYLFAKYLSNVEIFCLIVAFSDVITAESMQNLHERDSFEVFF